TTPEKNIREDIIMQDPSEPFCLDVEGGPDLSFDLKRRNRMVGYLTTFLVVMVLGTTEIFASWYVGILGGTSLEAGVAMGAFGFTYMFSPAIGGRLSDRIGRKKTLVIATCAYIALLTSYLLPFIVPIHLIVIRVVEGFIFGFIAPTIQGMVAELEPGSETAALGNFSTSWSASMILPPMILAYMVGAFGEVSSIYVVLAIELLSLAIIGGFLQGYRRKTGEEDTDSIANRVASETTDGPTQSKTSPVFIASYLSVMLWGVVSTIILALFPTYIEALIDLGHPFIREDFGNLLLIWNTVRTISFIGTARMPGEYMKTVIVLGTILTAISGILLFLFIDIWIFGLAMIISGIAVGFNYLGALYLVVSATELEKGAHAGLVESMGGVGIFLGPIIGGWVMGFGLALPYLLYTVLAVVVLILIVLLLATREKPSV
ncbi:MAG: MFS transporter, partial [Candidatus Thorarchaeota archaeon]